MSIKINLNNAWVISVMLLLFGIIIASLSSLISPVTGLIGSVLAPIIVGYIYAAKTRRSMPEGLRKKATSIYLGFQALLFIIFVTIQRPTETGLLVFVLIMMTFLLTLLWFYTVWALKFSSKIMLKSVHNSKNPNSS
jgi:hypothetical protein